MLRITFTFVVTTAPAVRARSFSKLAGKGGGNTVSLTYRHTVISRGIKSGDRGGQAIVPPRPIQATTVRLRWEITSRWKCRSVPYLVEKLNLYPYLAVPVV